MMYTKSDECTALLGRTASSCLTRLKACQQAALRMQLDLQICHWISQPRWHRGLYH